MSIRRGLVAPVKSPPRVGDAVVVDCLAHFTAKVERVVYEFENARTRIDLDWGEHGKSRVFAHDEGKIWRRVEDFN